QVARLAGRCEARRHVIGRACGLIVLQMARHARGLSLEGVVAVTGLARERTMRRTQRQAGHRVIPSCGRPTHGPMTLLGLRSDLQAVAIVLPPRPVTVEAARRRAFVDAPAMTRFAGGVAVAPVEGKRGLVVELTAGRFELRVRARFETQRGGDDDYDRAGQ